ncbi:NAD(P)/FAD-dependent oxidoreductase [Nocardioides aurantiacus]|uniref:NAD(P)/FAD-dependent oxidoreductase n=1 Tax=Nocardioides aurantiacus TaxID=86796 RepID=UPI00403F8A83
MSVLTVSVIGGGLAGSTAAHNLVASGEDVEVIVVEEDPDSPYDRPPLTKRLFAHDFDPAAPPAWAPEGRFEWRLDRAVAIDPHRRTVSLESGEVLTSDRVVIATGGRPRTQSSDMWGFACLRTAADARWVRDQVRSAPAPTALIEGAGPLGCEMATSLSSSGVPVTLVEADRLPMRRLLGPELGSEVAAWAVEAGVDLRLERHIRSAERSRTGRFSVTLSDGGKLEANVAISAIGMTPATELVAGWASADSRGIHCDHRSRVLSETGAVHENVYAIGDAAAVTHPQTGALLHHESWTNAAEQGAAVAADLLGRAPANVGRPYFWTEVFGRRVQVLGRLPMNPGPPTLLADYPERNGAVYRFDDDRSPAAWVAVNAPRDFAMIMRDEQAQQATK